MGTGALTEPDFLVFGAGGLGCPALLGLLASGARRLTLVDRGRVELANLQRQVLYRTADVGLKKVEAARRRLAAVAPHASISTIHGTIDHAFLEDLLARAPNGTIVLECTDDPAIKFLVNDLCLDYDHPLVIAGILGWHGQVLAVTRGRACLRCFYEAAPPRHLTPACGQAGIMGAVAGVLGFFMAAAAVALAEGKKGGRLAHVDLFSGRIRELGPEARPGCPACQRAPADPRGPRAGAGERAHAPHGTI